MPATSANPKTVARYAAIGSAVQAARKAAGLSQPQLAAQLGASAATIKNIEQGRRGPSAALATRLRDVIGVEIETACPCCGREWGPHGKG
jgi:transcriptional regulator with XRE-family HTH domain